MRLIIFTFLINFSHVLAKIRLDVNSYGTTLGPNFQPPFKGGIASANCESGVALSNGTHCCNSEKRIVDCVDGALATQHIQWSDPIDCCPEEDLNTCHTDICTSYYNGRCTLTHQYAFNGGRNCCISNTRESECPYPGGNLDFYDPIICCASSNRAPCNDQIEIGHRQNCTNY